MKVSLISYSDVVGGADRAAYRLHEGLSAIGIQSSMFVQNKQSFGRQIYAPNGAFGEVLVSLRRMFDMLPVAFHRDFVRKTPWSVQWIPAPPIDMKMLKSADIIHLHWVGGGFIPISFLKKINKPMVWTLHDMWPLSGGCHYSEECKRFQLNCGSCPILGSKKNRDLSSWVLNRKVRLWKDINLTIVAPSKWMAACAKQSAIFNKRRVEVLPYGIDTTIYNPLDRNYSRKILNLPLDKKLVLFGAMKATSIPRKGFQYLAKALQLLSQQEHIKNNLELMVFGDSEPVEPSELGFKAHYLGRLHDDIALAILFSAADVVVAPSMQDNLPLVVMEALACGTPCVAFEIGGMPDMIEHKQNGYLAKPFDSEDLARGIEWILDNEERREELSRKARAKVKEEYQSEKIAHRFKSLYEQILSQ